MDILKNFDKVSRMFLECDIIYTDQTLRFKMQARLVTRIVESRYVIDDKKLTNKSNFSNDLGLDSLDTVEVVMAIEEVRNIEL